MGRAKVVEVVCDRCGRTEHRPEAEWTEDKPPDFEGSFKGASVVYEDLCQPCEVIVGNNWSDTTRKLQKKSPRRAGSTTAQAKSKR